MMNALYNDVPHIMQIDRFCVHTIMSVSSPDARAFSDVAELWRPLASVYSVGCKYDMRQTLNVNNQTIR